MNIELIVVLVVVAVVVGGYFYLKKNPQVVQRAEASVEAKLPPVVQTALGVDHVGVVTAALQGAAQVVAAANPTPTSPAQVSTVNPVVQATVGGVPAEQAARFGVTAPSAPAPTAAPAAPVKSAFDPVLWAKAHGNIFDNGDTPFSAPVGFETTIAASPPGTAYYITNGVTDPTMSTPSVTDEAGNVLCSGYGDNHAFVLAADTKVKVSVTPNKIPAGCSIELAVGMHRSGVAPAPNWNLASGRHA